ncbi:MAG: M23 family metallopeptidase [Spirochaetales bacterium]|nr:M23 family metallopeptidase [Spirochaetales bacterium]
MRRFCLLAFVCGAGFVFAYQWPVKNIVLTGTFGESRWTHFHNGIDLGGGEQDVYPIEDGEVIFRFEEHQDHDGLPSGLGSFMVIEHRQRIRSLYAHLKPGSMNSTDRSLSTDKVLGRIGESGGSYGKHLHLTVTDEDSDQIINPLVVLPARIDSIKPKIIGLYTKKGAALSKVSSPMSISSGTYELLVSVQDPSGDVGYYMPMAPYRILFFMNGQEMTSYTFENIRRKDGRSVLYKSDDISFSEMYFDEWMIRLGDVHFLPGDTVLEVVVTDKADNETIRSFKLQVGP